MRTLFLILSLSVLISCQEAQKSSEIEVIDETQLSEVSLEGKVKSEKESEEEIVLDDIECAMIYDPVCASTKKDENCIGKSCLIVKATYSSSCTAKADGAEILYQGECYEEAVDLPDDVKYCPAVYNPVVGQLNNKLKEEKTFSNMCHLENANATFLRYGNCDKVVDK